MDFIVYAFHVPGEELPFYVGKGKPDRPKDHFQPRNVKQVTYFYNKLRSLLCRGIQPEIRIVASGLLEQQAFDLEISLIKIYGRRDSGTGCLCNQTDGGSGGETRLGVENSIDARIKLSRPRSALGRENIRHANRKTAVPVESFNLQTGILIKMYAVLNDVRLDGYSPGNVCSVCKGKLKQAHGLGWRYSS